MFQGMNQILTFIDSVLFQSKQECYPSSLMVSNTAQVTVPSSSNVCTASRASFVLCLQSLGTRFACTSRGATPKLLANLSDRVSALLVASLCAGGVPGTDSMAMLSSISAFKASSACASEASSESEKGPGLADSKGARIRMAAEGQGRSTSSTDPVSGTCVDAMFQQFRTCVVVKENAASSARQVTKSAFMVHSLLSNLECSGSSPSWMLRKLSMWHRFSLSRNYAVMLDR